MWCEATPDDLGLTLSVLAIVALLVLPAVLLSLGRDVRGPLALTWAVASVFAPLGLMLLGSAAWLPLAVALGAGFGVVVAAVERGRRRALFVLMGALGGAGWFTALSLLLAVGTGACLH